MKGNTVLFGDNRSMIVNASLPYSTLKKRHHANNFHRIREAVASRIVSIEHCDTNFNLADQGTKALNGEKNQFFLKNQEFPPVSTAGECQKKTAEQSSDSSVTGYATLSLQVQSKLDYEITNALEDPGFVSKLLKKKFQYWMTE